MIDYIYQVQVKRRTGWKPVYEYKNLYPMQSHDIDVAFDFYYKLPVSCNKRIVKIETHLICVNDF